MSSNGNAIYAMMGEIRERTDALEKMGGELLRRRAFNLETIIRGGRAMRRSTEDSEYRFSYEEKKQANPPGTMIAGFGLGTTIIGVILAAILGPQTCGFLILAGVGMLIVGLLRRIFSPSR